MLGPHSEHLASMVCDEVTEAPIIPKKPQPVGPFWALIGIWGGDAQMGSGLDHETLSILSRDWANDNIYFIPEYENLETNVQKELIK